MGMDPMDIRKSGVAMSFVPEDRLGMGLVGSMGMTGNMMLRSWRKGASIFLDRKILRRWHSASGRSWRSSPPARISRYAVCPAVTCRRCWWAARSPSSPPC